MTILRAIGTSEEVTTCDCCGRADLKSTVVMVEIDPDGGQIGDEMYYGCVCAARHSGRPVREIRSEAKTADDRKRIDLARSIVFAVKYLEPPSPVIEHYTPTNPNKAGVIVTVGDVNSDVWVLALANHGVNGAIDFVIRDWRDKRIMEMARGRFSSAYEVRRLGRM